MQSYTEILDTTSLTASRSLLLDNDKTALSCSSGSTFPTESLLVGMLCFRTDQNKLYQLVELEPLNWQILMDLSVGWVDCVPKAGNVTMSGPLTLSGDPTSALQAATKQYVDTAIPAGAVLAFARNTPPTGWLKCNGAAVSRTTYAALFAAIGTTYGAGDGSTTFNLPDLRGMFIRGWDDGRGVDASRTFGSWQDSANRSHNHGVSDSGHNHGIGDPWHSHSGSTTQAGEHTHGVPLSATAGGNTSFAAGARGGTVQTDGGGAHSHTLAILAAGTGIWINNAATGISIQANGSAEARPQNVAMLYCIKF